MAERLFDVAYYKGQEYRFVGKDDEWPRLDVWESHCRDCGTVFRFKMPSVITFKPNRRCEKHRRQGAKVIE